MPCAPPRLSEMTSAPSSTHQSTASAITESVPEPSDPIAFATMSETPGETPVKPPSATIIPAIAVPCPSSSYGLSMPETKSLQETKSMSLRSGWLTSIPVSTMHNSTPLPSNSETSSIPVMSLYWSSQESNDEAGPPSCTSSTCAQAQSPIMSMLRKTTSDVTAPMTHGKAS